MGLEKLGWPRDESPWSLASASVFGGKLCWGIAVWCSAGYLLARGNFSRCSNFQYWLSGEPKAWERGSRHGLDRELELQSLPYPLVVTGSQPIPFLHLRPQLFRPIGKAWSPSTPSHHQDSSPILHLWRFSSCHPFQSHAALARHLGHHRRSQLPFS